ncbi:MAG TPA: L-alanine-DL-glutamate epimerase [Bacillota bacterium]|nr:L-alanine-DL-glutamate epimerase [Bacillota bacterium]HOK68777.1 L-alanine-DL-glutamate epimerase [Bacillota bacterium]HPP85772.1 L-alanine-DL-glutamate epimerase [Bacillota bacterium]
MSNFRIKQCGLEFIREKLAQPFGFKGRYLNELWQVVVRIKSDRFTAVCPSVESVLWSDSHVFGENPPAASSAMMMLVTNRALKMLEGFEVDTPEAVIEELVPELEKYAAAVCGRPVAQTFVLNALVGIDYALWTLYAKENGISDFDGIIPEYAKDALSAKHEKLAHIPLISYAVSAEELRKILNSGTALIKIKIGKATGAAASQEEDMRSMLEWDKNRLTEIHSIASEYQTDLTKSGHILYYLDANGRYDTKERLCALLEHAEKIGALNRIALLEEPFEQENEVYVGDLPVVINADESAHSLADVQKRLALGYKAVALKPIAKTMSVSFKMAAAIHAAGGQCLCADLTVNPLLVEWNKQFAARIQALSGMKTGCLEVNGHQNYVNWEALKTLLPEGLSCPPEKDGVFTLGDGFYANSGSLFEPNGYAKYFID